MQTCKCVNMHSDTHTHELMLSLTLSFSHTHTRVQSTQTPTQAHKQRQTFRHRNTQAKVQHNHSRANTDINIISKTIVYIILFGGCVLPHKREGVREKCGRGGSGRETKKKGKDRKEEREKRDITPFITTTCIHSLGLPTQLSSLCLGLQHGTLAMYQKRTSLTLKSGEFCRPIFSWNYDSSIRRTRKYFYTCFQRAETMM